MGHRILFIPKTIDENPCLTSLQTGLVGKYNLDDTTDTLVDSVNGYNLTNSGGILESTGLLNKCVGTDGTDRDFAGQLYFDGKTSGVYTISIWINFNSIISGRYNIHPTVPSGYDTGELGILSYLSGTIITIGAIGWFGSQFRILPISAGVWRNFVWTFDLPNERLITYYDGGNLVYHNRAGFNKIRGNITFGGHPTLGSYNTDALFDNIYVWNRELSICEIEANYNEGNGVEL